MRGEIYFTMMRSRKVLSLKNLKTIQFQMTLSSKNGVNLPASILRLYYFCTHEQFFLLHSVFAMFDFDSKGTFENVVKNSKQIHIH